MVECEAVKVALGPQFRMTTSHWFLLAGTQVFRRGMLYILHGLYTWINKRRHQPWLHFTRRNFWRTVEHSAHGDKYRSMLELKNMGTRAGTRDS